MTPRPALRPIFERLAYAVYLAVLTGSLSATLLGWLHGIATGNFALLGAGLAGLAATRWLHVQGHEHWHFQQSCDSLDAWSGEGATTAEAALGAELTALLARFETESDVWVRGNLRREIQARLEQAPPLRETFAERLATHPEI